MAVEQQYSAAVVSGIAKKIAVELETLPMETHQAVVSMVAQLFQHRGLAEQNRLEREKQARAEEREQREAHQLRLMQEHAERQRGSATVSAISAPQAGAVMVGVAK